MNIPRQIPPPSLPASWRLAFLLGPAPVCALAASLRDGASATTVLREAGIGLGTGLLLTGGLALAARFFTGTGARLAGGLVFAVLLAVSGAAVGFAGCIPYPYIRTVRPVRAANVPPPTTRPRSKASPAPAPTPLPTPHKVLDWGLWPFPNGNE